MGIVLCADIDGYGWDDVDQVVEKVAQSLVDDGAAARRHGLAVHVYLRDRHDVDFELGDIEEGVCGCGADAIE